LDSGLRHAAWLCAILPYMDSMDSTEKPEGKRGARQSIGKIALPRIIFIDQEIASGRYPSTEALAEKYDTSISSISRDIEYMRDMLAAPIEYDAKRRGYYYTERTFRIPAGFATADEMLALGLAKNLLAMYQNTPVYDAAKRLLETITAPLAVTEKDLWFEKRIIVPPPPAAPVDAVLWQTLVAALRENRELSFAYQGANDASPRKRAVRPYQLLFDGGVWYLYAWCKERQAVRVFALPRMKDAVLSGARFTLPVNYDYEAADSNSHFGVFSGQENYHFRVEFFEGARLTVRERLWAADQQITENEDEESLTITFMSTQYDRVLHWVLSYGAAARPLEPERLVKDWAFHARAMAKTARAGPCFRPV